MRAQSKTIIYYVIDYFILFSCEYNTLLSHLFMIHCQMEMLVKELRVPPFQYHFLSLHKKGGKSFNSHKKCVNMKAYEVNLEYANLGVKAEHCLWN
jgi:hypothetical protein